MFITILRIELFKIFRKPRTYISFGAIAVMIILIQLAIKVQGTELINFFLGSQNSTFDYDPAKILNGYFVCYFILNTLLIHVPLLVALIAGDLVAGEANMGTLRLLVSKPVSREMLMFSKFGASVVYVVMLLLWMAVLSLFGSILLFGTNDLVVIKETGFHIISSGDVLWRFMAAFLFATLALICIASLAFMLSVFAENSIGPIVATVCIVIVFTIVQQLQVPMFQEYASPYLFTTHMLGWKGFFYVMATDENQTIRGSVENTGAILKSGLVLTGYTLFFLLLGVISFKRKDILS
ncbi:MAG: ABC transporter permease subunit [Terrimonas sp.]|nr:ABC transporter permease subunit [Terrimonas sp.]